MNELNLEQRTKEKPALIARPITFGPYKDADTANCFKTAMGLIQQRDEPYKVAFLDVFMHEAQGDIGMLFAFGNDIADYLKKYSPETKVIWTYAPEGVQPTTIDGNEIINYVDINETLDNYLTEQGITNE